MNENVWVVYTAVGCGVVMTRWTDKGPQGSKAVAACTNNAEATDKAQYMQESYDRLRKVLNEAYSE